MVKDNNSDNSIVAVNHGNIRAHKRHPGRRASPVFGGRRTYTYIRMKTPELIGAGKECFSSRRHKLSKLAAAYAVRPCGSKGF
jgi:hypothetical protein